MNVLAILEEYAIDGELKGQEFLTLCPFHNDIHPSCSIHIEKEVFRCLACDAKGDIYSFLAASTKVSKFTIKKHLEGRTLSVAPLSLKLVTKWHEKLLESKTFLEKLAKKGIHLKTVKKRLLGFDGSRITIPIPDTNGNIINVRKWLPKAIKKKMIGIKGHNVISLYPISNLKAKIIVITEGELKALLLEEIGIPTLTSSGGSTTWQKEWGSLFKDKKVYLCYDIDRAGELGAQKTAKNLYPYTREIYIVELPLDATKFPVGDITDFIVTLKHSKDDVKNLLKSAKKWEPFVHHEKLDDKIHDTNLSESIDAQFANKIVKTKVIVSAKDTTPYLIPLHIKVSCPKDQEVCAFCSCIDQKEFKIDKKHPMILEFINVSKDSQGLAIKKVIGIPRACKAFLYEVISYMNIEEVRLIPQIQIAHSNSQHVVRQAFYTGHDLETNANYDIQARVCPIPKTQHATLIIFDAEPAIDNLSTFKLKRKLDIFRPKEWTKEAIQKKLDELYLDFECNVTYIYKRPKLHLFYDLCYHSVLYIPFQNQIVKGWIEGLILGDSGQGKSDTVLHLQKHYGLGERVDVKSSSIAGLIGGLQETGNRWFITWGVIPLNDKRLVVLEEIKGMSQEMIAKLTETRSSGIAEIAKVEKSRTNARVRLIWISNPRTDRQILSYNYGVEAIKELIGNLEDIRRFDFAIILTVNDVDSKWINLKLKDRPQIKHKHTSELCQQLILWGWSRKENQVVITEEAASEILKAASEMGKKYTSKIPLVEAADQRLKLLRLSTALAVRTFSTENEETLIVRACHVEYITDFLNEIYSSDACGYLDYSRLVQKENSIKEEDAIIESLRKLPFAKSVVETFLDTKIFNVFDIIDWTELEVDECRRLVGLLVRSNAIKRFKRGYIKNPSFIALLKTLKTKGFKDETRYEKASKEEF